MSRAWIIYGAYVDDELRYIGVTAGRSRATWVQVVSAHGCAVGKQLIEKEPEMEVGWRAGRRDMGARREATSIVPAVRREIRVPMKR